MFVYSTLMQGYRPQPSIAFTVQGEMPYPSSMPTTAPQFGTAAALSSDGNVLVVGAPYNGTGATTNRGTRGLTWAFDRTGSTWGTGISASGTNLFGVSREGTSVALSADGNTLAVGAPGAGSSGIPNGQYGLVRVYVRSGAGSAWSTETTIQITIGGTSVNLGTQVALSEDGNTLAIGGPGDSANDGATWIYTRSGTTWSQQAKLIGTGATGATSQQGFSVALSADGNTVAAGAIGDDSNTGATWIFTRSGTTWTQQGSKLVGSGVVGGAESQGYAVALSSNGNTLAIGGYNVSPTGATWIFTRSGTTWTQQAKLIGTGAVGNSVQGAALALSADGNILAVGGPNDNTNIGATWIFKRFGTSWTQQGDKIVVPGYIGLGPKQGTSVALSNDATTLAIGAPFDNTHGSCWILTQ